MNKFTLLIHNKGWSVTAACDYWGIHYDTYNKRCNSDKFRNQLECMCRGLEDKFIENIANFDITIQKLKELKHEKT